MTLRQRMGRHSIDVVMASLITSVYTVTETVGSETTASVGELLLELPAVLLSVKLNVFALPLASADVISFPLWMWYCISLLWISQAAYYFQTDALTVCRRFVGVGKRAVSWGRQRVANLRNNQPAAVTDGGSE